MKNNILYVPGCDLCQDKHNKKLTKMLNKLQRAVSIGVIELEMTSTEFMDYVLNEIEECEQAMEEDDHA